jgi:hypothetical protein
MLLSKIVSFQAFATIPFLVAGAALPADGTSTAGMS